MNVGFGELRQDGTHRQYVFCRYCGCRLAAHVSTSFVGNVYAHCTLALGTDDAPYLLSRRKLAPIEACA